jgi:hypothetical protein
MAEFKAESLFSIPGRTAVITGGGEFCENPTLAMRQGEKSIDK